jgi:hypothetical protein
MKYSDFLKLAKANLCLPGEPPYALTGEDNYKDNWMCGAVYLASRRAFKNPKTPLSERTLAAIQAEIDRLKSSLPDEATEHLRHCIFYPPLVAYLEGGEHNLEYAQSVRHRFIDHLIEQALVEEASAETQPEN